MSPVFERVLVGFDGSESALDALALARRLADPSGELLLCHVDVHRAFRLPAHGRAGSDALAQVAGTLPARTVDRSASSAARGLCEVAEEERADLVVLGSHRGPDGQTTPSTTALRLLQGAPCALAIAPKGMRDDERLHHVGIAYDGSDEARGALTVAYAVAARDGAAVSIYKAIPRAGMPYAGSVAQQVDAAMQRARLDAQAELDEAADLAPPGVNPETVLIHNEAAAIADECDGIVDLLVMGSRGYGPVHRVFAGSTSEALMLRATQPVLVVPRAGGSGISPPAAASAAVET